MFAQFTRAAWSLLQPTSLLTICGFYGLWLLYRGHIGRARWWLAGTIVVLTILGFSPLAELLIRPLEERFPRPDLTDARIAGIIVLGGAENELVAASRHIIAVNASADRYIQGVALARRFPSARVVFSGGSEPAENSGENEAVTAARIFAALGIDEQRITLENRSRSTWENAKFTAKLVHPAAGERWLLVTSAAHMPRAIGTFRKAGLAVEAYPVDYRTSAWPPGRLFTSMGDGLHLFDYVVREYPGLAVYWLTGRSTALFPAP